MREGVQRSLDGGVGLQHVPSVRGPSDHNITLSGETSQPLTQLYCVKAAVVLIDRQSSLISYHLLFVINSQILGGLGQDSGPERYRR